MKKYYSILFGALMFLSFQGCSKSTGTWESPCEVSGSGSSKNIADIGGGTSVTTTKVYSDTACATPSYDFIIKNDVEIGSEKTLADGNDANNLDITKIQLFYTPYTQAAIDGLGVFFTTTFSLNTETEVLPGDAHGADDYADKYNIVSVDGDTLYFGIASLSVDTRPTTLDLTTKFTKQ